MERPRKIILGMECRVPMSRRSTEESASAYITHLKETELTEVEAASAIFSANALISLLSRALRFLSCCSISISSSSPYRCLRFRLPVSSNWTSVASRKNCTSYNREVRCTWSFWTTDLNSAYNGFLLANHDRRLQMKMNNDQ